MKQKHERKLIFVDQNLNGFPHYQQNYESDRIMILQQQKQLKNIVNMQIWGLRLEINRAGILSHIEMGVFT